MKKLLLFITLSVAFIKMDAQTKLNLEEYTGRYIFPAGSLTEDVVISIVNDTILNISASIGESNLKYVENESFVLPEYGATLVFIRDDSKNIQGFKVTIPMAEIDNLEARREPKEEPEIHAHK